MKGNGRSRIWISGLLLAACVLAAAPSAEARSHHAVRYKFQPQHVHHHARGAVRVVEIRRSSDALPAFVGFLGGLVLGTAIAHASDPAPVCVPPAHEYDYWDPVCDVHFPSLTAYRTHLLRHPHAGIVRVIDTATGECVHVYQYHDGDWEEAGEEPDDD
jgi:hypothetical protein